MPNVRVIILSYCLQVNTDNLFRALRDLLGYQLSPVKASLYSASLDKTHIRWVGVEDEDNVGQREERMRMHERKGEVG